MRVLFFGVGALGTLFAAKLCATGNDVSVLARGERLASLRRGGLRIRSRREKKLETFEPKVVSSVAHDDPYDLVIVLVRRTQVDAALRDQIIASGAASSEEGVALVDDLVALAGHRLPSLEALAAHAARGTLAP